MCTTYYVSSNKGKDSHTGLSPREAFATLNAVNRLKLEPGDRVLLECGSVFENQALHLSAKGTRKRPIVVAKYGEGRLPCICANGEGIWYQDYGQRLDAPTHVWRGPVSSAVLLKDVSHFILSDLEITNCGKKTEEEAYNDAHKMDRTGVAAVAKNGGTLENIRLRNLYVHDVEGNVYNKHMNNGGIYITALKPDEEEKTGVARYVGVTIEDCFVFRVSRWGICFGYTYQHGRFKESFLKRGQFEEYGHEDILIRNNYVKAAGGDGITVMYSLSPLVEHNTVDSVAFQMNALCYRYPLDRQGMVAAAIWPWKCKDALFCRNEAVDTRLNQDGMAFDADSGDGTVYEYNYSRLNEGGCVMFCLEQSVNNVFCHNLSEEDLGGTISPAGNPDAYIACNTFYVPENVPFIRPSMEGGRYTLENNIILSVSGKEENIRDEEKRIR